VLDLTTHPTLFNRVKNIDLADSIAGDGHKMLNVPYDCGFFFSKHIDIGVEVFQNAGAAYLSTAQESSIMSPLHIGIENSRRFRALPLYASLRALGSSGYREMLERQISAARMMTEGILHHDAYEILPLEDFYSAERTSPVSKRRIVSLDDVFIIVLFRAKDGDLNKRLVELINATKRVYVSGTQWENKPAVRIAVANWKVDPERETRAVLEVLDVVWQVWNKS
jgi:glutamate/tyrosine decarboxylase-like PLP-dependent enzyme